MWNEIARERGFNLPDGSSTPACRALVILLLSGIFNPLAVSCFAAEPRALQSEQDAPVTDCDTYAASALDPQHKAKGVPYDKIDSSRAIAACKIATQQYPNSSRFPFQLGRAYHRGSDFKAALVQYRKAAEQGHAVAKFNLGDMYANGQGVEKDSAQAVAWYQMAANQGLVPAQKQLGGMYYLGEGVTQNYAESRKWYRMAADNGDAEAQNNIGAMFDQGLGVTKDYAEAISWYRKAADRGDGVAQHNLGAMYFDGKGVAQSFTDAMKWYRKAADQGNAKGQGSIGFMYYAGQGVAQNYNEAIKWFRSAADQGDITAQKNLAGIYYLGEGVPRNYDEAMKWFRKAADKGDAYSQNILGSMYVDGQGVAKDYAEAANWYRKAADQGEANANNNLALLYARFPDLRGEGVNHAASVVQVASNDLPPLPETEKQLVAAVEKARAAYAAGANEMAQGAARPVRAKEICAAIRNPQISGWVGEVETLSSNSDGLGVLAIRIAKDIFIKTWNNSISDSSAKTLIDPESAVFKKAVVLKKGQRIKFSGQFIRDDTDCFREGSLSLKGSLTQPEFIFRFSDVVAIE